MKKVIIQHNGVFVVGYSRNLHKVYYTKNPNSAFRFDAIEADRFITEHDNVGHQFRRENVRLHLIRKGEKFNPFKEEANARQQPSSSR